MDPNGFDLALEKLHLAAIRFVNGDTGPWKVMCSHRDDVTILGGWGAYERGWESVEKRYDWASARYKGGQIRFENIARFSSDELGYSIDIEHQEARLANSEQTIPVVLRVTSILRREEGQWKLVHRHADSVTSVQGVDSVIKS